MSSCLVIAEAGVNHNGDRELAFKLVDAAVEAGADIVKFQTFRAKNLVTDSAEQCDYQVRNTGKAESQYQMLKRLELDFDTHRELLSYCASKQIEFLSTAFDEESLAFLVDELKVSRLKLPSGEITNAPLVLAHARTGLDIIVSTGMASLAEVEKCLGVIAFGFISDAGAKPSEQAFEAAYFSEEGRVALLQKVTILHCTTEYPAPFADINLRAMESMRASFGLSVGYSDHSEGVTVPIAAAAMGAEVIEKHFTLDKDMEGPDHKASLSPEELNAMVMGIRQAERALGDGIKGPRPAEMKNKTVVRKSLVAQVNIKQGEKFTADNLAVKRPGSGMSPMKYWSVIGTISEKDYVAGDVISES